MSYDKNKSGASRRPGKSGKPYVSADDRFYSRPKRTERPPRPSRPVPRPELEAEESRMYTRRMFRLLWMVSGY